MRNPLTPPPVTPHLTPDAMVLVAMTSDGVTRMQEQLARDIAAKALGWRPVPFCLFELIEMERLLPDDCVNVVMTHAQRRQLGLYCAHYYKQARDAENTRLAHEYDEFLAALLEESTLITFQL